MPFRNEEPSALARAEQLEVENAELRAGRLSVLDGVGMVLSVLGIAYLVVFPFAVAGHFERMFADLGSDQGLPRITRMVLTGWFAPTLALVPSSMLVAPLLTRKSARTRRLLAVGAFVAVLVDVAVCMYGLYAPIFAIAGAVRAE